MRSNFYQLSTWLKAAIATSLLTVGCSVEEEAIKDLEAQSSSRLSAESVKLAIKGITSDADSQTRNRTPVEAIDEDDSSRWAASGDKVNLDLDLGDAHNVDFINISWYKGSQYTYNFDVYSSNDGENFTIIDSKTSTGNTTELETYDLPDGEYQYLRLELSGPASLGNGNNGNGNGNNGNNGNGNNGNGNNGNNGNGNNLNSIYEIEVFGNIIEEVVEEPVVVEPIEEEPSGGQRAFITDTSDADTGELRLQLDETLAVGMMSVTVSKQATQDGFINLSGASTSRSNALIDMRIDDSNGYDFTESGDSVNAIANFPDFFNNELVQVVISWDATNATDITGPLVSVTIDGQNITDTAFPSESRDLASVMEGVRTIQFRLGGNGSLDESGAGMSVDDLKIYDLSSGTPVIVFEDDFESYVVGDSLDPNAATASAGPIEGAISVIDSPYRNNSFQVTVQGEGEVTGPTLPDPITGPEGDRTSPFSFSDLFVGDDFQVDNDSEGAHNWSAREYDQEPIDNGFDVRDYIFVAENRLILKCPSSEHDENESISRRRAEYRDQTEISLDDAHSMDFVFDIQNYDNSSELIMAQLHNDSPDARRPYITVLSENGVIRLQRTNAPTGSSSLRSVETIPFRAGNQYRITIESALGDRSIYARVINLGTGEQAEMTFDFVEEWSPLNGTFYWKFGAYMPDGGSTDTQMRMESIEITG